MSLNLKQKCLLMEVVHWLNYASERLLPGTSSAAQLRASRPNLPTNSDENQ